jgi:branched-subunit amino acid aminotransferase/4-amino-4-deoxychorismate lyase
MVNEILVPLDNLAIGRAYAAYEFFKIIKGKAFYLDRHLDRFFTSLNILKINIKYSRPKLEKIIKDLIVKNQSGNFQMKIYAIPSNYSKDMMDAGLYIIPSKIPSFDEDIYQYGSNLLMKEYFRFLPEAKSTNYIASVFWQAEMDELKAVDVLYYHDDMVLECSRGNIFIIKNGKVYTPCENILKGITRSIVIDLMKKYKIPFSVQSISKNELVGADEVFITSTTKLIMPIVKIYNFVIGKGTPGPVTARILELYLNLLE